MPSRELHKKIGELGMIGITCPEEYGGTGLGYLDQAVVGEEVARGSMALAVSMGATSQLCMN